MPDKPDDTPDGKAFPTPIPEPQRGFEPAEFEQRLKRFQIAMQANSLDVVMLTTEADIAYFTGFITQFWQSPTRPWFVLLPANGKPVAVIPSIGQACMARTWVDDIRTWSSPNPEDDGISLLQDSMVELAGENPTVGLPMGTESHLRMPLTDLQRLQNNLPGAQWADSSLLIQKARHIKSAAETRKIAHACSVVSTAFARLPEYIYSGMDEREVFTAFKQLCLSLGVDDTAYVVGSSGPAGYGDIISPPGTRQLQHGDILILDTGCLWDGYFCDFDRNYCVGKADAKSQQAHAVTWDATEAGLAAVKPGVSCAEVFAVMNAVVQPHSWHNPATTASAKSGEVGRLGHGLGLQLTETPSFAAFDNTIIEEGMVLTLEPGFCYAAGKMMVHEENIVVRANGAELLTNRAPREMPVIA